MPRCDYQCDVCGHTFEQSRPVVNRHDAGCPENCGGKGVLKPRAPGIAFKGAGWYITDYKQRPRT